MDRYKLLIGAAAFWDQAKADIAAARDRVLVQAMTFEADAAGHAAAAAMVGSPALDRRLLIDAYSFHVTNDVMLPLAPWQPAALQAEARATRSLFDRTAAAGVEVRVTNPVGRNPLRFPLRNHKKLLVIDDVAYLGGINFSDHNFAWHDLMLRIDDPEIAAFLAADFERDWLGTPACRANRGGALDLVALDGSSNEAALTPVVKLFAQAQTSIEMIGAYPTLPFTEALANAARRGCAVTIYTPAANNKPMLRDGLFALASRSPVQVRLLPAMTHAKAALVDGATILFGSVNFNLASFRRNGDLLAMSREPGLVGAFERGLFAPARAVASPALAAAPQWRWTRADWCLRLADRMLARLRHGPVRSVAWPAPNGWLSPAAPRSACPEAPPAHSR